MKRPEIRIIQMTENEYDRAMKQFLGKDYEFEKDAYYEGETYMPDFNKSLEDMMEIADTDETNIQYAAWIVSDRGTVIRYKSGDPHIPIKELPESFNPDKFIFDDLPINLDYEDFE